MNTRYLIAITLLLTNCGSDDSKPTKADEEVAISATPATPSQTIALETNADLPACEKANKGQLAYVIDEETFYSCDESWAVIEVKGKNGKDGVDGQDGISSNSSNLWHDQITGLDWVLGGPGTSWMAEAACTNGYREANSAEGLLAAQHGIRAIASLIGLNMEFWTGVGNDASYIGLTAGVAAIKAGVTSDSRSIFCVK